MGIRSSQLLLGDLLRLCSFEVASEVCSVTSFRTFQVNPGDHDDDKQEVTVHLNRGMQQPQTPLPFPRARTTSRFADIPKNGTLKGFHEAPSSQVADVLLGHLMKRGRVAIVSRFGQEHAQAYVDAIEGRGLQVRFVSGQIGVQDFLLPPARQERSGQGVY